MKRLNILIALCALIFSACNPYAQDGYEKYYVVESYLIANAPLPEVKVSTTLPVMEKYSFEKAAVENAVVNMQLLSDNGEVDQTYRYQMGSAGIYKPVNTVAVLPERRYRLNVSLPDGHSVQAETFVPGDVEILNDIPQTITYQAPKPLQATINPSFYPGRQSYFIFSLIVNGTPDKEQLTPFYYDSFDEEEDDISDFYTNSSPILNEETYEQNPDGTLSIHMPWAAVAFYGENRIVVNAIDNNMYDFIRSQNSQVGGGSLPPGQIQNVIYHVEGGIGIFAGIASDTVNITIRRN